MGFIINAFSELPTREDNLWQIRKLWVIRLRVPKPKLVAIS